MSSAIVDILLLSQSTVLVASASSFSQWAEFLGAMPSVWFPAQWVQDMVPEKKNYECEADEKGNLPPSFLEVLQGLSDVDA